VWTEFIWLRIGTAGGNCGQGIKILGFIKCRDFLTSSGTAICSKSVRYRCDVTLFASGSSTTVVLPPHSISPVRIRWPFFTESVAGQPDLFLPGVVVLTVCTLCSTKIKRPDISYVPLRQ